jgi:hypothetical protein
MYLRYGHSIKSLDENTLFPDAWEVNVEIKDLTPNNFNTYIHHFIHGFQSNVEILKTKVKKDQWITHTDAATRDKMRSEMDRLRTSRQGDAENTFVLFAAAAGNNTKNIMLENARMAAGITDGWMLDQLEPTEAEKNMQIAAQEALDKLNRKREQQAELTEAVREQQALVTELERQLQSAERSGNSNEAARIRQELASAKQLFELKNTELATVNEDLSATNTRGVYAEAVAAAEALAKAQYCRTRGINEFNENDEAAQQVIQRQVALQIGEIPQTTQVIMDIFDKIRKNNPHELATLRDDLEDGKIDNEAYRQMWNEYAPDSQKVDSTGAIGRYENEIALIKETQTTAQNLEAESTGIVNTLQQQIKNSKLENNEKVKQDLENLTRKQAELKQYIELAKNAKNRAEAENYATEMSKKNNELKALREQLVRTINSEGFKENSGN